MSKGVKTEEYIKFLIHDGSIGKSFYSKYGIALTKAQSFLSNLKLLKSNFTYSNYLNAQTKNLENYGLIRVINIGGSLKNHFKLSKHTNKPRKNRKSSKLRHIFKFVSKSKVFLRLKSYINYKWTQ